MTTLRSVKWNDPKDLKEDINFLESMTDDYNNGDLGSVQFMMYLQTMITRIIRITKNVDKVANMRYLEYKLDKLIAANKELDTDKTMLRLKIRDVAYEVVENLYDEYMKL